MVHSVLPNWLNSVHHDGSERYVSTPLPRLEEQVTLRLRAGADAPVRRVFLRTFPDGEQALTPMSRGEAGAPAAWWECRVRVNQPHFHYRFVLEADDGVWFYTAAGPTAHIPWDATDFCLLADYEPPGWLDTAIFYQIFPDRFHNGDPATNPRPEAYEFNGHRPRTYAWGAPPPAGALFPLVFYGGDLPGITAKLDYLQDLGVNALYLTPVFTAYSNHKYDVADYDHVDPHFGGDDALVALRRALDARAMRYILDVVPNHCGYWHPWFQAARADASVPEAEFFTFINHPDAYASWLGVWVLPKLNYRSAELRRRMYAGESSVFRRWLRPPFAADGWRVDVANMLGRQGETQIGQEVVQDIRRAVKETRPGAYLMGENFFDATASLQGDQWDGVMNYAGLATPLLAWLVGYEQGAHGLAETITSPVSWPTAALAATWQQHLAAIPWQIARQQFNVLNSHDTPRLRSRLQGNVALQRLAVVAQFTFPGVPCIYYGDEIGLVDTPELASRGCMVWDEAAWDQEMRAFYQALIRLRRESAVLQRGGFRILAVEADLLAYQREGEDGSFLVILQRSQMPRPAGGLPIAHGGFPDGAQFVEQFSGQTGRVVDGQLALPALPQGATLWHTSTVLM
ncbi:MAG: glycoside hydrolase family 13 protein [Ardenticatenaceae bacterium]|nr:glycoside hydrolase family 13 protein [Ardenticatenaceae bacterium]